MRRALDVLVALELLVLGGVLLWLAVECTQLEGAGQWLFLLCVVAAFWVWSYFADVMEGKR